MSTWKRVPRQAPQASPPTMTVYAQGRVGWNRQTHEGLGEPEHVEIVFNEMENLLGIRQAQDGSDELFTFVVKRGSKNAWYINCRRSLDVLGIDATLGLPKIAKIEDGIAAIDVSDIMVDRQPSLFDVSTA